MIGAILGDMVGVPYEFHYLNTRDYNFPFWSLSSSYSDDTLMTLAIAKALIICKGDYRELEDLAVSCMQRIFLDYPKVAWGDNFAKWIRKPRTINNSMGNGAAMRISPVGWVAETPEQLKELVHAVTCRSHDHPESYKGAEAIAMGVYLARNGSTIEEIREKLSAYYPELKDNHFNYNYLHSYYETQSNELGFHVTCPRSVPQAIECFLDSENLEDCIRKAVTIGGDSDTIACMAGAIGEAYYGISYEFEDEVYARLPLELQNICNAFRTIKKKRIKR